MYTIEKGIASSISQKDFFQSQTSDKEANIAFIESMTDLGNGDLLISKKSKSF